MADDNILRSYRSSDAMRRAGAAGGARDEAGGSDPLAELARLIGQTDPFADPGRNVAAAPAARQRSEPPASDWRHTAAALARESVYSQPAADAHDELAHSDELAVQSYRTAPNHHFDQHVPRSAPGRDNFADEDFDDAPRFGEALGEERQHDEPSSEDTNHALAPLQPGHPDENYFFDDAAPADDAMYDDPPRKRAANGLLTAIVLIGCAIFGTAGAYGYRTYFSAPRSSGDTPIIVADKTPSKVVPASTNGDAQSGKSIQDRVGETGGNERMVKHQEDPVALGDPTTPRVVLPAPFTPSPGPGPSVQSGPAAVTSAGVTTEPKKVHTVPIRPDGSEPPRSAGGPPAAQPLQLSPSAVTASVPRQPPAPARPASSQPVPPQPARNSGAPLSLEPGDSASAYQSPPRDRVAAVTPPNACPRRRRAKCGGGKLCGAGVLAA